MASKLVELRRMVEDQPEWHFQADAASLLDVCEAAAAYVEACGRPGARDSGGPNGDT
jgi:hypothetical protein